MAGQKRVRTPWRQELHRARVGVLPLLVWVAGAWVAVQLWLGAPRAPTFFGLAQDESVAVNASANGRVRALHVALYQHVSAGAPLVTLDDAALEAEIQTARTVLAQLSAQVSQERARMEAGWRSSREEARWRLALARSTSSLEFPSELRAFHADEADLRLALLRTRLDITTSALEVDRLDVRWRREDSLANEKVLPVARVDDLTRRLEAERQRGKELQVIADGLVVEIESAARRREELLASYQAVPEPKLDVPDIDAQLVGVVAEIAVQESRAAELALRRADSVVRAPATGRIASIAISDGQFVQAGELLMAISIHSRRDVVLWVPESTLDAPGIGDRLVMRRASDPRADQGQEGEVLAMSPRVHQMPERLWRDLRIPEYGRSYLVRGDADLGLVPGERVRLDPHRD